MISSANTLSTDRQHRWLNAGTPFTLLRGLGPVIATAAILTSEPTALLAATASPAPRPETYRQIQGIDHVLGSKHAIGYFQTVDGQCALTLMLAEATDPESPMSSSPARLQFPLQPGQRAELASAEGPEIVLQCGPGATTVEVKRDLVRR
jgi:hypothetical protein